uniref:CACTA en-spm transposon protein n=1 Tax=Steinernema glaseri TaxID=37863 RepID=A0A1I8A0D5_9BILA
MPIDAYMPSGNQYTKTIKASIVCDKNARAACVAASSSRNIRNRMHEPKRLAFRSSSCQTPSSRDADYEDDSQMMRNRYQKRKAEGRTSTSLSMHHIEVRLATPYKVLCGVFGMVQSNAVLLRSLVFHVHGLEKQMAFGRWPHVGNKSIVLSNASAFFYDTWYSRAEP